MVTFPCVFSISVDMPTSEREPTRWCSTMIRADTVEELLENTSFVVDLAPSLFVGVGAKNIARLNVTIAPRCTTLTVRKQIIFWSRHKARNRSSRSVSNHSLGPNSGRLGDCVHRGMASALSRLSIPVNQPEAKIPMQACWWHYTQKSLER